MPQIHFSITVPKSPPSSHLDRPQESISYLHSLTPHTNFVGRLCSVRWISYTPIYRWFCFFLPPIPQSPPLPSQRSVKRCATDLNPPTVQAFRRHSIDVTPPPSPSFFPLSPAPADLFRKQALSYFFYVISQ